jgi:hypothetical protein
MAEYYWCSGLELGDNAGYPEMNLTGATIQSSIKRTGTYALYCNAGVSANAYAVTKWYNIATSRISVRIYFYPTVFPASGSRRFAKLEDAGGNNYSLRINSDGTVSAIDKGGSVLGTSAALTLDSWNMIGWVLNLYSTPKVALYLNGVQQFNATATTILSLTKLTVGFYNSEAVAAAGYFDDLACKWADSGTVALLPGGAVRAFQPNGPGYTGYSRPWQDYGSTPNWNCVEEIPVAIGDYVKYDNYYYWGKDYYALSDPVPGPANGCSVTCVADRLVTLGVRSSGADRVLGSGPAVAPPSWQLFAVPVSVFSMTAGIVAALQAVLMCPSGGSLTKAAQVTVHVDYTPLNPDAPTNLKPTGKIIEREPTFSGDYVQGGGGAMAWADAWVYTPTGSLVWQAGPIAASGTHYIIGWNQGGTALGYENGLIPGASYKWQSRTCDIEGHWSPFSALQDINVNAAPLNPLSCTPTGAPTLNTETPQLQWTHTDPNSDPQSDTLLEVQLNETGQPATGYPVHSCLATDSFTRVDSPSSLGSDEKLPTANTWSANAGTWGISVGEAYCITNPGTAIATLPLSSANVRLRVRLRKAPCTGVVFRLQNTSNYWCVRWVTATRSLRLSKWISGAEIPVQTSADLDVVEGLYYPIKIVADGDNISVYFAEGVTPLLSTTDSALNGQVNHGLWAGSSDTTGRWDDFSICTSASESQSHTVPAGRLSYGNMYQWKVRTRDSWLWGPDSNWNLFFCAEVPTVTITTPSEGETIEDPTPAIQWSISGDYMVPQQAYQVIVYNEDATAIVHDSTKLADATTTYDLPSGVIHNLSIYMVKVHIWDSAPDPQHGISEYRTFDTSWPVPGAIANVAVVADMVGNPHITVSWDESGLGGDFDHYNVYRREVGGTTWTRITTISVKGTISYDDYHVAFAVTYEYNVTQVQVYGDDLVESPDAISAQIALEAVDAVYLHLASDYSTYIRLRFDPSRTVQWNRDEEVLQFWGETKPTKEIGTAQWRTVTISINFLYDDTASVDLLEELFTSGNVLLYRDPRGRRMFVQPDPYSESDIMPVGWGESLTLLEVEYDEEVQQ